jgi:hypothetical protein
MSTPKPAILALEDGSIFRGRAFGADATVSGECVFNTSMTGYQEILTDPSYFGQIVTMTAVQIGNYGINDEDTEATVPKCTGFVVRELSPVVSNWRSKRSVDDYLKKYEASRRRRDEMLPQHAADQRERSRQPRKIVARHGRLGLREGRHYREALHLATG